MILYKNETRLRAHRQNGGGRFFGYALMERKYSEAEAQFGIKKSSDTRKAEWFFKERGIRFQSVDMKGQTTQGQTTPEVSRTNDPRGL